MSEPTIAGLDVHAFEIPTDGPDGQEQDGTMTWSSTTIVLVQAHGGGQTGLGYTYGDASAAVGGRGDGPDEDQDLTRSRRRPGAAVHGAQGGRERRRAVHRRERRAEPEGGAVLGRAVRRRMGRVLVRGAGQLAGRFRIAASSQPGPAGLDIAAGQYGYLLPDFTALAGAVDCLQADVTRCGGITGLLQVGGLAEACQVDLSGHCAPAVSAHAFCGVPRVRHLEYFHTHVRLEGIAFDGVLGPSGGALVPDRSRPGLGLDVKWPDLEPYRVAGREPAVTRH